MAGLYKNLLLLSLAVYVVCMLVSLADTAPIEDDSVRERRWANGGPGGGRSKIPQGGGHGIVSGDQRG